MSINIHTYPKLKIRHLFCWRRILSGQCLKNRPPALVFERLWQKQQLPDLIHKLSGTRQFQFDIERAVFALALQRLCVPGSDLQGSQLLKTVECEGFEAVLYAKVPGGLGNAVSLLGDQPHGLHFELSTIILSLFLWH